MSSELRRYVRVFGGMVPFRHLSRFLYIKYVKGSRRIWRFSP